MKDKLLLLVLYVLSLALLWPFLHAHPVRFVVAALLVAGAFAYWLLMAACKMAGER